MKDKQWKDYWDVSLGVSYISLEKIDPQTDLVELEEGGMFDEDTMPDWMKNIRSGANKPAPQTLIPDAVSRVARVISVAPILPFEDSSMAIFSATLLNSLISIIL